PSTGIMPTELTLDHTGPMTSSVADNALLLEVIAGDDGLDPRQYAPRIADYTSALRQDAGGLSIGVVTEGFGHRNSESEVDAQVRKGADRLAKLGPKIKQTSLPMPALPPHTSSP